MAKKFFEYSMFGIYPLLNEVTYPHCPTWGDEEDVFLVYAKDKEEAFKLAMAHLYEGKPFDKFYGPYAGEIWHGVKCLM